MKRNYKLIAGLISAAALAASSMVYAQPGGMGGGMGPGRGAGMGPGMGGNADAVASRLTNLKAELKITPAQEADWKAFADVVTQQSAGMQALREQMWTQMHTPQAAGTAPDFASLRNAMISLRETNQSQHRAAFDALYAKLTPEQKAVADQRFNRMAGPRGGRGCWGA